MKIGDQRAEEYTFGETHGITKTGRVVWIHPERRFYVVEFKFDKGKVRESYFFPGRGGKNEKDKRNEGGSGLVQYNGRNEGCDPPCRTGDE